MRVSLGCIYRCFIFLFFFSCASIFVNKSLEKNSLNILALKSLMAYPELKISNSEIEKYSNFNKSNQYDFDILKTLEKNLVYISESSYDDNIKYMKKLSSYNKILYKVILAYSLVQGLPFQSEILSYLNNHNIREKFSLRINFPFSIKNIENKHWVMLDRNFFDIIVQDKSALIIAKQKMESILKSFSK